MEAALMPSTTRTLQQLADQGKLRNRDIDIIMVAAGYLSYEVVEEYLAHRDGQAASAPVSLPRRTVPEVAQEITERICGCQYQDGGSTRLVSADARDIYMQVEGACVFCPQIRYTIDILKQAIRFRVPEVEDIVIDGTRFEEKTELPVNNQLTMSMLVKETGLSFADLDDALKERPRLIDSDVARIGAMKRAVLRHRSLTVLDP
jgi:Fe-S cluster biogenesis protein NfuA